MVVCKVAGVAVVGSAQCAKPGIRNARQKRSALGRLLAAMVSCLVQKVTILNYCDELFEASLSEGDSPSQGDTPRH
jgi:hypothetical protein